MAGKHTLPHPFNFSHSLSYLWEKTGDDPFRHILTTSIFLSMIFSYTADKPGLRKDPGEVNMDSSKMSIQEFATSIFSIHWGKGSCMAGYGNWGCTHGNTLMTQSQGYGYRACAHGIWVYFGRDCQPSRLHYTTISKIVNNKN